MSKWNIVNTNFLFIYYFQTICTTLLQGELGELKNRVGTLEKMLAQKELQLLDLQEHRGALQAERDGLKGELQHLRSQHCSALKKTQEQAHKMMVITLLYTVTLSQYKLW